MKNRPKQANRAAFTLIEMMVVVAIIGILIAGVFRMMSIVGESNKKAVTTARMQKLQNALSGFYAEYGTYPPVTAHGSPDPFTGEDPKDGKETQAGTLTAENANRSSRSQPLAFEYPNAQSLDDYINTRFQQDGIINVNQAVGQIAATLPKDNWQDVKLFKFGVLSYLLPRVELMGGEDLAGNKETAMTPKLNFFKSRQWTKNNAGTPAAQRVRENRAAARWMPNFENIIGGGFTIMGIDTAEPYAGGPWFMSGPGYLSNGTKYVLMGMTIRDGWGNELYYYSAPPYQSYRVWSAGPNGVTFPPWITLDSLSASDRKTVSAWVDDDVVRFDR